MMPRDWNQENYRVLIDSLWRHSDHNYRPLFALSWIVFKWKPREPHMTSGDCETHTESDSPPVTPHTLAEKGYRSQNSATDS